LPLPSPLRSANRLATAAAGSSPSLHP
jgi:hypothetical protein